MAYGWSQTAAAGSACSSPCRSSGRLQVTSSRPSTALVGTGCASAAATMEQLKPQDLFVYDDTRHIFVPTSPVRRKPPADELRTLRKAQLDGPEAYYKTADRGSMPEHLESLLHHSHQGDALNLESLFMDRPSTVNVPINFDGGTSLHVASMRGHGRVAEMLLRRGVDVNRPNTAQQTSLHSAAEANQVGILFDLLVAGANADRRDATGQTALHKAAFSGSADAVLTLLDYKADARLCDEGGMQAIHKAATMGRTDVIGILLERDTTVVNAHALSGWTPLHLAAHGGHSDSCELLLEHEADVTACDHDKARALHRAAAAGSEAACAALLRAGADPMAADISRQTALHIACEEGSVDVARLLLEGGMPPDGLDGLRRTPLQIAAEGGQLELCEVLVQYGADPHLQDIAKGVPSPHMVARRRRFSDIIALFDAMQGQSQA